MTLAGIAGVFDRVADTYDNVGVEWFQPIAAGLVGELNAQPGERVLDIGCGRGAALGPLARAVGPTGRALGIDLAPAMVRRTAEDLADLPQVEVRVDDASAPTSTPESFDLISSSLVLFFLPDPLTALRGWLRLLVPGGRLGVTTFGPQDERWQQADDVFTPYLPPIMADARTTGRLGPFGSDPGMESLLREAGLVDVRTAHRTVDATFRDVSHLLEFTWSHGQRAMWDAVPKADHGLVRQQIVDTVREYTGDDGSLTFHQSVRYTLGRRSPA